MTSIVVRYKDKKVAVPIDQNRAQVETLVAQARDLLIAKWNAELPPPADFTVWSVRLQRELGPTDRVVRDEVIELRATKSLNAATIPDRRRSIRATPSLKQDLRQKTLSAKKSFTAKKGISLASCPPGLPGCRLGIFDVAPLKVDETPLTFRFRPPRLSLSIRLLPYEQTQSTSTVTGPLYSWSSPMKFYHVDPTRSGLLFLVCVYDEPLLGSRTHIGNAFIALEAVLDSPGIPSTRWARIDPVTDDTTSNILHESRLLVAICFHPKVSHGPTLRTLLHTIAHADVEPVGSDATRRDTARSQQSLVHKVMGKVKRRNGVRVVDSAVAPTAHSLRRAKGVFCFKLCGLHLCGMQCSKTGGHSTLSLPEFSPTAIVRFDDFEHEVIGHASNCDGMTFEHEWPVYSSYSMVELCLFRKATLRSGPASRKLKSDGSLAVKVGRLAISCFRIQERYALSWTLDKIDQVKGPGNIPPKPGFLWYPLLDDDEEEIGLAQIAADYHEDIFALVDADESPDLTYISPDERSFDASIIQRNFERLDELFLTLKEAKSYFDDILDWKSPPRSIMTWMSINGYFFFISGDYLPLLVSLLAIVALLSTLISFIQGMNRRKWIEHNPGASKLRMFRPIATLRFAPIRGHHLSTQASQEDHPDSFVRIYYEPNYKNIPVQQVAVTECARQTQNPEWSTPQRDSGREDFIRRNNGRFKEMLRHLTPYTQDAVLHDVVEPWPRKDGNVDVNAFRLSILQPVEVDPNTGDEVLVDWRRSPGTIRFDVLHDDLSEASPLIGRVRVPLRSLITDEACGGPQNEFELTLPLVMPSRHANLPLRDHPIVRDSQNATATIVVRMQMILRNPNERIALRDNLASEALYEAVEMEVERELSWVAKYHKAKDVAKNFQQSLGAVCSTLERLKNLLLWVHPRKTLVVLVAALVGCLCFFIVPMKYFVLYSSTKAFTRKFHKAIDDDVTRFRNFLASVPSDLDMKEIYMWENRDFLKAKEHSEAQTRLQAQWSGYVFRQSRSWLQSWQERYAAIRGSRLEFWHSITDARAGIPPKASFFISDRLDTCSRAEAANIPRDCFPLVVYDVSRPMLAISPVGRRRIICLTSEDSVATFSEAVRRSGEPMATINPS